MRVANGPATAFRAAQPLMRTLDVPAGARASYYIYNQRQEIDALIDGLRDAARMFGFRTEQATPNPSETP